MTASDSNITQRLFNMKDLPTIPVVHNRILKLIGDVNYSVDEVSRLIERDQVLSTKVLKLVNSPFYGLYSEVAGVRRAVVLLGANLIRGIILSTALFDIAEKKLPGLWDHSYCCSMVAGFLAKQFNFITIEEIMAGALLHDIGKVLIRKQLPEEAVNIDNAVKANRVIMRDAENMVIAITHDKVGVWLADTWNFPRIIKDSIAYHHKPSLCSNHLRETAIVHISDIIVKGLGISYSADRFVPAVDEKAWKELALTDGDLADIMVEVIDILQSDKQLARYMAGNSYGA
ncbi:MAG: HDOD domain-containing protein [Nitrospirae bacterium]|nr:HDOD domain-containing protein [Nitrospirota bacterium]